MTALPSNSETTPVRDRLLNAAEQVVARHGVRNLTLQAVAKEAGVSKGGLLYHFPSKSALITAIVDGLACRCEAGQDQALQRDGTGPGAFTRAYLTARMQRPDPQKQPVHTAILAGVGTDPQYLNPFRERLAEWQTRLEADGIDPAIASIVRLAIDGLCMDRLLGMPVPQGDLHQRVIEKLIAMTMPDGQPARQD
jgi:AcrR family transcriptional regulator